MREIFVEAFETTGGFDNFRRDFEWISRIRAAVRGGGTPSRISDSPAVLRLWRPADDRVSAGRFHRIAFDNERILRRLSGGRMVGLGPGVVAMTLIAPSIDWLDTKVERLLPEQVLNRALRPLLAALRELGVDPFYAGRDLVTVHRRPLACAAFTTMPDGLLVVEIFLGVESDFRSTGTSLARWDPDGIAAVASNLFVDAVSLSEVATPPDDQWLVDSLSASCREFFGARTADAPQAGGAFLAADSSVWGAFQQERGPTAPAAASAAGMTMLGVVEAEARILNGKIHAVTVCGDLIAPFETLEEISRELEGTPAAAPAIRRALEQVLNRPGRFVLGGADLVEILTRLL